MQTLFKKLSGVSIKDSENALRLRNIEAFAPVMDKETSISSIKTSQSSFLVTDCSITLQELQSELIVIKISTVSASQFSYITGMLALLSCLASNLNNYALPTLILAPSHALSIPISSPTYPLFLL